MSSRRRSRTPEAPPRRDGDPPRPEHVGLGRGMPRLGRYRRAGPSSCPRSTRAPRARRRRRASGAWTRVPQWGSSSSTATLSSGPGGGRRPAEADTVVRLTLPFAPATATISAGAERLDVAAGGVGGGGRVGRRRLRRPARRSWRASALRRRVRGVLVALRPREQLRGRARDRGGWTVRELCRYVFQRLALADRPWPGQRARAPRGGSRCDRPSRHLGQEHGLDTRMFGPRRPAMAAALAATASRPGRGR